MTDTEVNTADLAALVGSRLCHDLISPIGAIGNGLELLELAGMADSEEMGLIRDSINAASARVQFYRIAFGAGDAGVTIPQDEVDRTLKGYFQNSRMLVHWTADVPQSRAETRMAFLALACLESALAWGGTVTVKRTVNAWSLAAQADRFRLEPGLWDGLARGVYPNDISGGQVHFGLLVESCRNARRPISVSQAEGTLTLLI